MAGTAIDLSLPLRTPTVVSRARQAGNTQEQQLYAPTVQDYFASYLQDVPASSVHAISIPIQTEQGMVEQSMPIIPLQIGNGYVYNQQQPGQATYAKFTTSWGQPIIPKIP